MRRRIEPGAQVVERPCEDCGQVFQRVTGYVNADDHTLAAYNGSAITTTAMRPISLVDHILIHDPVVREHLYGPEAVFAADDQQ